MQYQGWSIRVCRMAGRDNHPIPFMATATKRRGDDLVMFNAEGSTEDEAVANITSRIKGGDPLESIWQEAHPKKKS